MRVVHLLNVTTWQSCGRWRAADSQILGAYQRLFWWRYRGADKCLCAGREMFAPLAPVFEGLGEKLSSVWQWFKDLIAPVKATQDTLNSCREVGVVFGQALADALLLPLTAFNKLRSGIDWVLEKLGIINKESSTLDQTAAKASAATQNGYTPAISSYNSYQPVTAPAGKTYIDQSRPTYQITLPGNGMPGGRLGNDLQDALEKYESKKRADARASMRYD